jgi:hypothetical protein
MKMNIRGIIGTVGLLMATAGYCQIDITGLQRIPPDQVPQFGTFWYANGPGGLGAPPLPFPPDDASLPIYVLDAVSQQYVIDDSSVDYGTPSPLRRSQAAVQNTLVEPPGDPYATNLALVAEWLHVPLALPDGTDWTFDSELNYDQQQLLGLAAGYSEASQAGAAQAADWSAATGEPVTLPKTETGQ